MVTSTYDIIAMWIDIARIIAIIVFTLIVLFFFFKRHSIKKKIEVEEDEKTSEKLNNQLRDLHVIAVVIILLWIVGLVFALAMPKIMPSQRYYVFNGTNTSINQ